MTKFERFRNRISKFRSHIIQYVLTFWRYLADKIGIRHDPSASLAGAQEHARVLVQGEPAVESHTRTIYPDTVRSSDRDPEWELKAQPDIDFGRLDDLEAFAEELTVPKETIERWIAAGILTPVEIRVAERLIKIMREKDRRKLS